LTEGTVEAQHEANPAPIEEHGETVPIADPDTRQNDELRVMVIGFLVGMTIAGVFLVYIVLEAARLLT
jgi:hypothetical protein